MVPIPNPEVRAKSPIARQQIFDFAVDVCRYRVLGGSFSSLIERARSIAAVAAAEGVPIETPITDLFSSEREYRDYGQSLGWQYQRAYRIADPSIDPLVFYTVSYENGSVTIESKGVAGAAGEVTFGREYADDIFRCVSRNEIGSYVRWADDPYPIGGRFLLQRIDDPDPGNADYGRLRILAGDVHPCRGDIQFGETSQELSQLGAFVQLRDLVSQLFDTHNPTETQRSAVAQRAKAIIAKSGRSFMPTNGYCWTCGGDVTEALGDIAEGAAITGCPLCCSTWCD